MGLSNSCSICRFYLWKYLSSFDESSRPRSAQKLHIWNWYSNPKQILEWTFHSLSSSRSLHFWSLKVWQLCLNFCKLIFRWMKKYFNLLLNSLSFFFLIVVIHFYILYCKTEGKWIRKLKIIIFISYMDIFDIIFNSSEQPCY